MRIKRIYNNNVILAEDSEKNEVVLFGKGLGFGLARGDAVKDNLIEKKFEFKDETGYRFKKIVESIPEDIIKLTDDLIIFIKSELNQTTGDGIYVTLTDHISNLIERVRMGIKFDEGLLWNVKQLYPTEYKIGIECVRQISERLHISLDYSEANFIALHIINAETNMEMSDIYFITGLLDKISTIVCHNFESIDKTSYSFERFMIHCRLFARNLMLGKTSDGNSPDNKEVYTLLLDKYPKQAHSLQEIEMMLTHDFTYAVSSDEALYLLLHLIKLTT